MSAIFEIKTGVPMSTHVVQVVGQRLAVEYSNSHKVDGRRIDDGDSHQYFIGGKEVPGVTTVIKVAQNFEYKNTEAADRGTWIHKACAEIFKANDSMRDTIIDSYADISPELYRYLRCFGHFLNYMEVNFDFTGCESEKVFFGRDYGTTLDYYLPYAKESNYIVYLTDGEPITLNISKKQMEQARLDFVACKRVYALKYNK